MKTNFSSLIAGIFIGAATGAVIALLNAAQPGKETQAQIRDGIVEVSNRTKGAISDVQARTLAKMDEVKHIVKEIGDEAKQIPEKLANTKVTTSE